MQYGNTQYGNTVYGGSGSALVTSSKTVTQDGKADVKLQIEQNQSGIAKVVVNGTGVYNQYGVARIELHERTIIRGRAFVIFIVNNIINGKSRIVVQRTNTQSGQSSISSVSVKTQDGQSRIQHIDTVTQSGIARIIPRTETQDINGISRLEVSILRNQTGKARISLGRVPYVEVDKPETTIYEEIDKPNTTIYTPVNKPNEGIYTEVKRPFR